MSIKYSFEELDQETRDYLLAARDRKGIGMPGIMIPTSFVMPWLSLIAGFAIITITIIMTFPPKKGPIPMALGQTAGFLLGGWMVVAAFRTWIAYRGNKAAGQFIYADPEFLYQCKGSIVEVYDLINIRSARVTHNYNNNVYKNSVTEIRLKADEINLTLNNEELAGKLVMFLNAVVYMRDGGNDGKEKVLQELPPSIMAAAALHVAHTGELPERLNDDGLEITFIPRPKAENRKAFGLLGLFGTMAAGVGLFLFFFLTNPVIKQETEWDELKNQPMDFQVPQLRAYLADERNTSHREEAKTRLIDFYKKAATDRVKGNDPGFTAAMARLITDLSERQPYISIAVRDKSQTPDEGKRKHLADYLADRLGATVGDTLVNFALLDKDVDFKAQIELEYTVNGTNIDYTIEIRPDRTAEPIFTKKGQFAGGLDVPGQMFPQLGGANSDPNLPYPQDGSGLFIIPSSTQTKFAADLVAKLVGAVRSRPLPPRDDF